MSVVSEQKVKENTSGRSYSIFIFIALFSCIDSLTGHRREDDILELARGK